MAMCACATVPPCEDMRIPAGHTKCREQDGNIRRKLSAEESAEYRALLDGGAP